MPNKPWVRDDVIYTVGGEEYTIPAESILVGEPRLESEPITKDEASMYLVDMTANTEHGTFRWQTDIERGFGWTNIADVEAVATPTAVSECERPVLRSVDSDDAED
jgi:hypothetical protein